MKAPETFESFLTLCSSQSTSPASLEYAASFHSFPSSSSLFAKLMFCYAFLFGRVGWGWNLKSRFGLMIALLGLVWRVFSPQHSSRRCWCQVKSASRRRGQGYTIEALVLRSLADELLHVDHVKRFTPDFRSCRVFTLNSAKIPAPAVAGYTIISVNTPDSVIRPIEDGRRADRKHVHALTNLT